MRHGNAFSGRCGGGKRDLKGPACSLSQGQKNGSGFDVIASVLGALDSFAIFFEFYMQIPVEKPIN